MKEICSERQPTEEILQCCFARKGVLYSTVFHVAHERQAPVPGMGGLGISTASADYRRSA